MDIMLTVEGHEGWGVERVFPWDGIRPLSPPQNMMFSRDNDVICSVLGKIIFQMI